MAGGFFVDLIMIRRQYGPWVADVDNLGYRPPPVERYPSNFIIEPKSQMK
jgi:hypothetical protein